MKQSAKIIGSLFFILGIVFPSPAAEDPVASIKKAYAETSAATDKPDIAPILKQAAAYQQLFLMTFK